MKYHNLGFHSFDFEFQLDNYLIHNPDDGRYFLTHGRFLDDGEFQAYTHWVGLTSDMIEAIYNISEAASLREVLDKQDSDMVE